MAIRTIIQVNNPLLKAPNHPVENFKSSYVKNLIQDLKDTMVHEGLIGIAAPQIGENIRAFITHPTNTTFRKVGKADSLRIYINPTLIYASSKQVEIYEGCGCVPGINEFGPVIRPKEIKIHAYDENQNLFELFCDGILARVIQHELDHLSGIEFLEKVVDKKTIVNRKYYIDNIKSSLFTKQRSLITKIEYKKL